MIPAALTPLAIHLWQSTLFAAVAGLLTLALRRNQARVRYWLWLAASYKFLVPFSWLVSIGHQFQWRAAPTIVPQTFSAVTDLVVDPLFLTTLPVAKPAPDHLPALVMALCAVWACGFVTVAVGWALQWLRVHAIVRAASPLPLGLPIRILSTTARLEPGVVGVFRPVLLLPEGITVRLTQAQLQAVLAHELCHVRRRDNLAAAVHMLVEAMFWFYPLVWWLGARMVDERERACDEGVLQAGNQAQVYAESILKVCEFYLESPLTCVSGISGSDLKKRMERIMEKHFGEALSARKKLLLAAAGLMALAVPVVSGVLTAPPRMQSAAGQGPNVKVGEITFQGNVVYSNRQLIRAMHNSRPYAIPMYLFDIPLMPKTFGRQKLKEDLEGGIRLLYQNNGYFKVFVRDPILTPADGAKATNITIPIQEGAQYRMGRLVIRGANPDKPLPFKPEALEAAFPVKRGDIFDVGKVRAALNGYAKLYSDFTAAPDTEVNEVAETVDLTFDFSPKSQASRDPQLPTFDAASVKQNKSGDKREQLLWEPGGRLIATNATLRLLVANAYHLSTGQNRLASGAPNWMDSERFDLEASVGGNPTAEQQRLWLQSLLADRFGLAAHYETRQLPVYALVLAEAGKTGPQLLPHTDDSKCLDPTIPRTTSLVSPDGVLLVPPSAICGGVYAFPRKGTVMLVGEATMEGLAWTFPLVDRVTVDRTGLKGSFHLTLTYTPEPGQAGFRPGSDASAPNSPAPPTLSRALQEQLGLKLEPQTGPVDVLVIDQAEEPLEN
jgi:uncharacterized protein (TIGR03435 family)